ncbi:MAG: indole-3-glycerol phosphate synthase TrpC [Candidatus Marinimicrobia bacterium]|jgi:indole-3-glycerol phosphate synthase|nr:indole-3-glycerol phosphate synthase TrpC [Candidatus Neomarinimicrobiota bacterium]
MNILEKIIDSKLLEVAEKSKIIPIERLQDSQRLYAIRDFKNSLQSNYIDIIAEIKRKSPSMGDILPNSSPKEIAKQYMKNGASAISVLTDEPFFGGKLDYISEVKAVVDIPILRKDFIITEYQIWESYHAGADAILLIADALAQDQMKTLYELAHELGLHVLVETHDLDLIPIIVSLNPEIVGINCRNLKNMETDIQWFSQAIELLPPNSIKVAESGIFENTHLEFIETLGFDAALVGTSLMKTGEPGCALAHLLQRSNV